jgi:chromosome segregation ATPase
MITEKDKQIIALKKEGRTVRQIAQLTRSSFGTISSVLKKAEDEEKTIVQNKTMLEEDNQAGAKYTQAMEMFSRRKSNIDIAKKITGMKADEILSIQEDYWRLNDAEELARIYANSRSYLSSLLLLYNRMRQENIDQDDLVFALKDFKELRYLNEKIFSASDRLEQLLYTLTETRKDVHSLEHKMRKLESIIENYENKVLQYREKFKSFREFEAITDDIDKH